jgi:circadian clock protein KaiC
VKRPKKRPTAQRLSTGLPQLDVILSGGLLPGGSYIFAGAPGAGKTILANQLCFHHVAAGGRCLYVTLLSESHGRMLRHIGELSFFDPTVLSQSLHYVSGYSVLRKDGLRGLGTLLRKLIKRHDASLLVIDGLARVEMLSPSLVDLKQFIHELNVLLEFTNCTALLLTDNTSGGELGYPANTMVDGLLNLRDSRQGLRAVRELIVEKFRGSAFLRGVHFFDINDDGIAIYPRIEARLATPSREPIVAKRRLSLGVAGLDRMTGGGLSEGTSTLVLGSSGTGKTTLGLHFMAAGFAEREPALYFGFFESAARLLKKGDELGLNLTAHAKDELLHVAWQPGGEVIMDALAERILETVQREKIKRLVIDGLAGFEESLGPERLKYFFKSLTNELRGLGVATLLTVEMRELFGPEVNVPLLGLATVAENIVLLRQVEIASELKRAVAVMKTRESAHDDKVRELTIGARGLLVGEPFKSQEAVLRGGASASLLAPEKKTKGTGP